MTRKIIHIDMDAFFASIEQRDFPGFKGKPIVVGGLPDKRGVVAAASYEARKFGIHSAMSSARAKKLCPDTIFVYPRFEVYKACSRQILEIFRSFTPVIEPLSLDEAFLDVTDSKMYRGSATLIARAIKEKIKAELDLTASAGISYCKFLAKVASDMDKPDGLFVITPDQAQGFIGTLPIRKFFGIGKVTEARMHCLGIFTGADLKELNISQLQRHFGKTGEFYYNIVRGIDERPVKVSRVRKSIGKETTFASDITDIDYLWQVLNGLAKSVAENLLAKNLAGQTVTLKVKYANFEQITRSITVKNCLFIGQATDILHLLPALIARTELGTRPVRLVGVTVSHLVGLDKTGRNHTQIELFGQHADAAPEDGGLTQTQRM